MTNENDLISRADAIEAVAQQWLLEASAESPYVSEDDIDDYRKLAEELLSDIPSAEAVQGDLVRCNECKHYRAEYGSCTAEHWDLSRVTFPHVEPNDYCSYGEKKK